MKRVIPDLDFEEIRGLTDVTLSETSDSIVKQKIAYRRKRVNELRLRGCTNQEIADKIGCNLSTIEKDLKFNRENARTWFEHDSITEYCQSVSDGVILCDNVIEDLQILYQEDSDIETKLKILAAISEYESRKTHLYERTKSVQRYLSEKSR